ncbi:MAG: NTP transferase domain-containing protein [Defluviitaleaceae bacterium]|nr:NTP transferase domain-containing protein [Defluviitaleaceae bacterium]MCL2274430.1 NTP transferase domain-containing protein [Defluviitaleaceae bacterium]
MTALILNSGTGTRMGTLTHGKNKCLVEVADGITILDIQLQALLTCGVRDFCITTGPYADALKNYVYARYPQGAFSFVHNPIFDSTNYIYSIYLARTQLQREIIMLHGDLLFDMSVLKDVLAAPHSVMVVDAAQPLPEKDFKAVVENERISKVGVEFFTNAMYAQPLYKLNKDDRQLWLAEIERFCKRGETHVYAENALNAISHEINIRPLDIKGRNCFEVDNPQDLEVARQWYLKAPAHETA